MNLAQAKALESAHLMPTYARFPVNFVRGEGVYLFDDAGRRYLDFGSGIGVNSLGCGHEKWVRAVCEQAALLQHVSNLYYTPATLRLAQKLCDVSGMAKVFLCNSGAEANECAVKLARKYSSDKYGPGRHRILTLTHSFHGRTLTTLAATGQESFHVHFHPFTEGFRHVPAGDFEALEVAADDTVCAVMAEPVQGEGGVRVLDDEYLSRVREWTRRRDILLICDEVQTGIGRTGAVFASAPFDPDIVTSAKGLGGGLPVGACLCTEALGGVLGPGTHGTTYGGNPVVCAGALCVLETVCDEAFLAEVRRKGELVRAALRAMPRVTDVRGKGLMIGFDTDAAPAKEVALRCLEKGLAVLTAKDSVRLLPPLVISEAELNEGLVLLAKVLEELARIKR